MGFVDFEATLKNFDDDLDLFESISAIFLEDAPTIVSELNRHVQAENIHGTTEALHKLKGLVANFHANRLVQEIAAGEAAAKEGRMMIDATQTASIAQQIVQISDEIREYLALNKNK